MSHRLTPEEINTTRCEHGFLITEPCPGCAENDKVASGVANAIRVAKDIRKAKGGRPGYEGFPTNPTEYLSAGESREISEGDWVEKYNGDW